MIDIVFYINFLLHYERLNCLIMFQFDSRVTLVKYFVLLMSLVLSISAFAAMSKNANTVMEEEAFYWSQEKAMRDLQGAGSNE